MKAISLSLMFGLIFCLNSWGAEQQANNWNKRFQLRGGMIVYDLSGDFSSTRNDRPEIDIDLDDLDLKENKQTYFLGANLRLGERWRLHLDYFHYDDDGSRIAERSFEFDDLLVKVGARVESKLQFDLYVVNIGYDFYKSDKAYFGAGMGAHIADFELEVAAAVTVNNDKSDFRSEDEELTAPMPNLYLGGAYALRDDVIFKYGGGWMSMSYGDYDGDLFFASGALEYWPFSNVGLGAGYAYRTVDIERDTGSKKEKYDIEMPGPIFYVTIGF